MSPLTALALGLLVSAGQVRTVQAEAAQPRGAQPAPVHAPAATSPALSAAEQAAAARVTAAEISGHTRFLADDLLEGRFPGGRGEELAVRYVAAQLEAMGYRPGATDAAGRPSWFQEVPLVRHVASVPPAVSFRRGGERVTLATGPGPAAEVVVHSVGGVERASAKDSELVFVGYGIVAPEHGWDDYRGVDVRGKVVVLLNFNPPWAGERVRLWYGRWDYKYLEAARHGAAGALLVHTTESAGYPWKVVATSNGPVAFALPPEADADPRLPFQGWIGHDAAARLFRLAGRDLAADAAAARDPRGRGAPPRPLGVTMSLDMPVARERIRSANVVGVLPGTDPQLRDEAVLFTAHHDHLGVRDPPVKGERNVYAGALDNASGCAAVLAIARAAAGAPPRRSVVVAFVTAEEQGLLGARWYATHPTVKPGRIAVDVNVDTVNIFGRTTDVGLVGLGKSTVDEVVKAVAAAQGRTVHGDPYPDRGSFYRSDDFELARVGVPGARLGGGPRYAGRPEGWGAEQVERWIGTHYHQPGDADPPSPEAWDLTGAVEDAQLQLVVGLRIANDPELPRWRPGDEFEKARLAAPR
jgi:Zn-dependent M28 family amino/carboxypeptidase